MIHTEIIDALQTLTIRKIFFLTKFIIKNRPTRFESEKNKYKFVYFMLKFYFFYKKKALNRAFFDQFSSSHFLALFFV